MKDRAKGRGGEDQYTLMIKHLIQCQNYINYRTHTLWCVFNLFVLHSLIEGILSSLKCSTWTQVMHVSAGYARAWPWIQQVQLGQVFVPA